MKTGSLANRRNRHVRCVPGVLSARSCMARCPDIELLPDGRAWISPESCWGHLTGGPCICSGCSSVAPARGTISLSSSCSCRFWVLKQTASLSCTLPFAMARCSPVPSLPKAWSVKRLGGCAEAGRTWLEAQPSRIHLLNSQASQAAREK